MLHVVAVEALLFLSRRDLDKMCAVSTRLETLIALACGTYPFRRLRRVDLKYYQGEDDVPKFDVSILDHGDELAFLVCETFDEALTFLGPFYHRTYVDELFEVNLGISSGNYRVSPGQWTDLTNIFRSGAARHLKFWFTDLSLLGNNAFVDAVRCSRLEVTFCGFRGRDFSDDVLRSCAANGVVELQMWANESEEEYTVSDDALLEYCFPPSGPSRVLQVDNLPVSETFAAKFLERLLAPGRTSGPRGFVEFTGAKLQCDLEAYARHLVPGQENPTYRYESLRDEGGYTYHFIVDYRDREYPNPIHRNKMQFNFGYFDLAPAGE